MAAAAVLKFCFISRNSATFARICTKFCTVTLKHVPETGMLSDLTSDKIQDSGGRHIEIHINGYNSAVIAHISTKFDADTGNDAPQKVLTSEFASDKIQDGGSRRFEILL